MKALSLLSIFLALPLCAQTAKVVQLSPEDAKLAKELHEKKAEIEKRIADLESKIEDQYLSVEQDASGLGSIGISCGQVDGKNGLVKITRCPEQKDTLKPKRVRILDSAWYGGFEYSEDFRFVVPKPVQQRSWPSWSGGTTINPACWYVTTTGTNDAVTVPLTSWCGNPNGICAGTPPGTVVDSATLGGWGGGNDPEPDPRMRLQFSADGTVTGGYGSTDREPTEGIRIQQNPN